MTKDECIKQLLELLEEIKQDLAALAALKSNSESDGAEAMQ